MAIQVNQLTVLLVYTRQKDGTYVTSLGPIKGQYCDPDGGNASAKVNRPIEEIVAPAFNAADSISTLIANCFAAAKTGCGGV